MLFDEPANRLHAVRLGIAAERLGAAPQTGAISRLLGMFGFGEELHVLAARAARRAGWRAVHAGARDGEHKFSITGGVARHHGIPARVVVCFRGRGRLWLTG